MQSRRTGRAWITAIWIISAAVVATAAHSGEPGAIVVGTRHQMVSQVLNETRPYLVHKPEGYDFNGERYPVLILLDADGNFAHTSAAADFLATERRIPPMLVVGITNTNRTRDLTLPTSLVSNTQGGADRFLSFIATELIPDIERQYRTRPYRVLVGHSLGGLIAVYSLQQRPELFNGYIAISPSLYWDQQVLVRNMKPFLAGHPRLRRDLYITLGNEEAAMLDSIQALTKVLTESAPAELRWQFHLRPNETHNSNRYRSTYDGLEAIFDGWDIPDPLPLYRETGLTGLADHYAKVSARMSYPVAPTIHVVQRVFLTLLKEQRFADAEALLKQFRDWHPNEATAYYQAETMLASAMKDEKRAKEFATKWLLLAPGSASARGTLEEYGVDISTIIPTVVVPVKVLATYIGQYRASNMALDIAQQGDKLYATTDDGRFELRAKGTDQSSTTFYFVGVPFEGRFLSTKSGELTLQLMRGNTTYVLNKVK